MPKYRSYSSFIYHLCLILLIDITAKILVLLLQKHLHIGSGIRNPPPPPRLMVKLYEIVNTKKKKRKEKKWLFVSLSVRAVCGSKGKHRVFIGVM